MPLAHVDLQDLLRRLAAVSSSRTEADVQADVRLLLEVGSLGLTDAQLESQIADGTRRRIDVEAGYTVFEVKKDLTRGNVQSEAETQLAGYVETRANQTGQRYVGVLTDGRRWRLYHLAASRTLEAVAAHDVTGSTADDVASLLDWLGAVLATQTSVAPTPVEVERRLGAASPGHALDLAALKELWDANRTHPEVLLKRQLWGRLLTTALGTAFTDDDDLFLNHTYLVITAEVIAHELLGLNAMTVAPAELLAGTQFAASGVHGVVEADFFDWPAEVVGGDSFVRDLARRVTRFDWSSVGHDVMKHLYESVIDATTRKNLGEYYTADWLADRIVRDTIAEPLETRALDPACGSGTFLFHAARLYLDAADRAGIPNADAIEGLTTHVLGIDLHPVAVALARTTYLLAIGVDRLRHQDRGEFRVPVFLGDSLQWQINLDLFSSDGITIYTDDGATLLAEMLQFPSAVTVDPQAFDDLVQTLVTKATSRPRSSPVPAIKRSVLSPLGLSAEDQATLAETFRLLCHLHDHHRDHVWGYYVRNLTRPLWLSRDPWQADVLIGNPPWVAYRFLTEDMQRVFRERSQERRLWAGNKVATNQDLAAYFVVRASELYLKPGGRFAFVMPRATLDRQQHAGFRAGKYETCTVAFAEPWDLDRVRPHIFPVPSAVVRGAKAPPAAMSDQVKVIAGKLPSPAPAQWAAAARYLSDAQGSVTASTTASVGASPYGPTFKQGATVVPRVLHVVRRAPTPPLGLPTGQVAVASARTTQEKAPWKGLPDRMATVEADSLYPLLFGTTLLPFRLLTAPELVLPWINGQLRNGADPDIDERPLTAAWWREAERLWRKTPKKSPTMTLTERLDFHRGITEQFPPPRIRVVYSASGKTLAAAVVTDQRMVVEHKLYWATAASVDEARYLTGFMNAGETTRRVEPLQSRGLYGPRDFDKYVWHLNWPTYDPGIAEHRQLAALAERAERVAAAVPIKDTTDFKTSRKIVRDALLADGVATALDTTVSTILGAP